MASQSDIFLDPSARDPDFEIDAERGNNFSPHALRIFRGAILLLGGVLVIILSLLAWKYWRQWREQWLKTIQIQDE
jgi:hypothetical protein